MKRFFSGISMEELFEKFNSTQKAASVEKEKVVSISKAEQAAEIKKWKAEYSTTGKVPPLRVKGVHYPDPSSDLEFITFNQDPEMPGMNGPGGNYSYEKAMTLDLLSAKKGSWMPDQGFPGTG